MDIRLELLSNHICDAIRENLDTLDIDFKKIADTQATKILSEIKEVICNDDLDDFMAIDKIVDIFSAHNIDVGGRHDF